MAKSESPELEQNRMGIMPVNKLMWSMSLPIMVSMMIQALYNIVDSIFVSRIDQYALMSLNLSYAVQNILNAIGTGIAIGFGALMANYLGKGDRKRVQAVAGNAVVLLIASWLLFLIFGLFFTDIYFRSQTDIPEVIEYGKLYLGINCCLSFGVFTQLTFERMLQSVGRSRYIMFTQGLGAVMNIILDPILIFGWLGFPALGVAGAAIATVFSQICTGAFAFFLNKHFNKEVKLHISDLKPDFKIIREIFIIALPTIIMNSISSFTNYFMNKMLIAYDTFAPNIYGIYNKLLTFVSLPMRGLGGGCVPIIAYNYGAKKKARLNETIKLCIIYCTLLSVIGFSLFQILPEQCLIWFEATESMLEIGVSAIRIMSISLLVAGFSVAIASVFQGLLKTHLSMWASAVRQLVALLPIAYLFSGIGRADLIWWAYPLSDVISLIMCLFFLRYLIKKIITPMEDSELQTE